jgi:hypothetical protein
VLGSPGLPANTSKPSTAPSKWLPVRASSRRDHRQHQQTPARRPRWQQLGSLDARVDPEGAEPPQAPRRATVRQRTQNLKAVTQAGDSGSSRNTARSAAIVSGFHFVRFARMRFLTLPSSR